MKKTVASLGWILLVLPFISIAGARTVTYADITEDRQVEPFTAIVSSGSFDVFITMGSKESLRLEGDPETLKEVETVVEDGALLVQFKKSKGRTSWKSDHVKIYITAKSLHGLKSVGSSNIKVDGEIKTENLYAEVTGSGNIESALIVSNYVAKISGSGKVIPSGTAASAHVIISGSGDFTGKNLNTNNANIQVSGSGNASIHAENSLNAAVSGSGDISYSGNAKVNSSVSGSGSISKL